MLITIRHGQTNFNKERIYSGKGDTPRLTNEALLEAYKLGKTLVEYNLDIAFVSPLTRARQTFLELNKSINIPYINDGLLIERDFKEYEGKALDLLDPKKYWNVKEPDQYPIEPITSLIERIEKFLNKIKKDYSNKNILIVAHSGVCRAIKYIIEGKKEDNLYNYNMENLHVDIFNEW